MSVFPKTLSLRLMGVIEFGIFKFPMVLSAIIGLTNLEQLTEKQTCSWKKVI